MCRMLFGLLAIAMLDAAVAFAEARIWTDRTGRQIEAEYISFSDGKVEIKRSSDGETFNIPIERLSDGDQQFVRSRTHTQAADSSLVTITVCNLGGDELSFTILPRPGKVEHKVEHKLKPNESVQFKLHKGSYPFLAKTRDTSGRTKRGTATTAGVIFVKGNTIWNFRNKSQSGLTTWDLE